MISTESYKEYVQRLTRSEEPEPFCPFRMAYCNDAYSDSCYGCQQAQWEYIRTHVLNTANLYRITADYRPNNQNKPHYYKTGKTASDAKRQFESTYPWLKVYECAEVQDAGEAIDACKRYLLMRQFIEEKVEEVDAI